MAKTSFQLVPPNFDFSYSKALKSGDRFYTPVVRRNTLFHSYARKKGLTQKSLLPELKLVWDVFTTPQKDVWNSAGAVSSMSGFKLLVQDTAYRRRNGYSGYSIPNDLWQASVGRILINAPATNILIAQEHPLVYFVLRKVSGTRNQYASVRIVESFDLPIDIKIRYRSDLVSAGANPSAKFYVKIISHYQGGTIETLCEIIFSLSSGWTTATASLSQVRGIARGYTAYIQLDDVTGNLYFDNIEINHSGFNWARDRKCNDINQDFTRSFYQIPKHWGGVDVPATAFFDSYFDPAL